MDFRLLGPLEVWRSGELVPIGQRRAERCLLGLLLLEPNRIIGTDRLGQLLWDDAPSANARGIIRSHISRLRSILDPDRSGDGGVRLLSRGDGYLAQVDPEHIDITRFRLKVSEGRACADPVTRAKTLRAGLDLWRGPLLADVASDLLRERIGRTLSELRLRAWEDYAAAELEGGDGHAHLVPDLIELVAQHPTRQDLVASLMLALHRSGRQNEALQAYRRLYDELGRLSGLAPSTTLIDLHLRILRDDPRLAAAAPAHAVTIAAPPPPPAQLPSANWSFVGRTEILRALDDVVAKPSHRPHMVVISAITGTAGVGKTALAIHWAHRIKDQFPDGQLYVNLRGFDPDGICLETGEVLRLFLDALHVPPASIPASEEARRGLYRSLLADRRMLVLLDNARHPEQVRPLLPGSPGCLTVVTSRNQLTGLVVTDAAIPLSLGLLDQDEARDLLAVRIGHRRIGQEPGAVEAIIRMCAGLPLALAIVAARAASDSACRLAVLATQLQTADQSLEPFNGDDAPTNLRAVFSWSYQILSPAAARVYRLLGLHPGPDLAVSAVAAMAAITVSAADEILTELVQVQLASEQSPGRYSLHDLLQRFSAELSTAHDAPSHLADAWSKLLAHYENGMQSAALCLRPSAFQPERSPEGAPTGSAPVFATQSDAVTWFDQERSNILALAIAAAKRGDDTTRFIEQARRYSTDYLNKGAYLDEMLTLSRLAMETAERQGRLASAADSAGQLATAQLRSNQVQLALVTARHGLSLARQAADLRAEANSLVKLGLALGAAGQPDSAEEAFTASVAIRRTTGDRHGEAIALHNLADMQLTHDRLAPAVANLELAVPIRQEVGDPIGTLLSLVNLGKAHCLLGNMDRALATLTDALTASIQLQDRPQQWQILIALADVALRQDLPDAALARANEALEISRALNHRYGEILALRQLSRAYARLGESGRSLAVLEQARAIGQAQALRGDPTLERMLGTEARVN